MIWFYTRLFHRQSNSRVVQCGKASLVRRERRAMRLALAFAGLAGATIVSVSDPLSFDVDMYSRSTTVTAIAATVGLRDRGGGSLHIEIDSQQLNERIIKRITHRDHCDKQIQIGSGCKNWWAGVKSKFFCVLYTGRRLFVFVIVSVIIHKIAHDNSFQIHRPTILVHPLNRACRLHSFAIEGQIILLFRISAVVQFLTLWSSLQYNFLWKRADAATIAPGLVFSRLRRQLRNKRHAHQE
ncbi:hypothetical protein BT96DRAFT_164465 [Gymnopus androsaceus JB14]|uniref:Uncharacterized protein n=1 Tax=Gymnopus androsaceus JB14 TaxID=1447944 RepID=A0A6A4H9U5_9AGAR|nr:hypothetical protein BT96DRAFT_164465 [Gymnopus androsaceus JB14]